MKKVIIFSGFNQRAVIAFIRTLEKLSVDYAIIACTKNDTIFKTKYKNKVITTRQVLQLDLNDIIIEKDKKASVKYGRDTNLEEFISRENTK